MSTVDIEQIQTDMKDMKGKVDKMFYALMGNEIAKDGGLVARIEHLETSVENLEKASIKLAIYQRIMWTALGATSGIVFTYLVQLLKK